MKIFLKIILLFGFVFLIQSHLKAQPSITWQRVLNYTNNSILYKTQQTSDGGYVAIGSNKIGIYYKIYLLKFNEFGDTLWSKFFDLNVNSDYEGYWIEETIDKGFIISGWGAGPNGDAYLLKTDSLGSIEWYKTFGGFGLDQGKCVKQLPDKGFILMLRTTSVTSTNDIMIIRTDSLGNKIWSKIFGNNMYEEFGGEIQVIGNSGYIIAGTKRISGNPGYFYIIRTDTNGDSLWTKTYYQYLGSSAYSIDITPKIGFIIGGVFDSTANNKPKASIVKTDNNGSVQWQRNYSTGYNEYCFSIRTFTKKGFVFCGMSDSTYLGYERAIMRIIDTSGNILQEKFWNPGNDQSAYQSVELTNNNGIILCGFAEFGSPKAYIVRTDSLGNIKPVGINNTSVEIEDFELYQNFPNPFNSQTKIKYVLSKSGYVNIFFYDISGKIIGLMESGYRAKGNYNFNFNAQNFNLASGIYFYSLTYTQNNINKSFCKKFIYLK